MSWQRILAFARERDLPVIVTDIAGREPLVVMPFAQFEELSMKETRPALSKLASLESLEPRVTKNREVSLEDVIMPFSEEPAIKMGDIGVEKGELSLEEQFYLEPIEEGESEA
jgi:hypothetical protein